MIHINKSAGYFAIMKKRKKAKVFNVVKNVLEFNINLCYTYSISLYKLSFFEIKFRLLGLQNC